MAMGIAICMAIAESVHIHSVLTLSNQPACVYNIYKKKQCSKNEYTNNAVRNGVCVNHGAKRYCTMIECGNPFFQVGKCRFHFRCLLAASTINLLAEDVTVAANAIVGMGHVLVIMPQSWTLPI